MSDSRKVVVVGSYPPIPLASSRASLDAVRSAWRSGDQVTVVSPRLSAAHLQVPVTGVFAGRRLSNVRRHTGATELVLVAERGFPVPLAPRAIQSITAAVLAAAMAEFERVTVVRVGSLAIPSTTEARLLAAATELVDYADSRGDPRVTPLGPVEALPSERARQLAGKAKRALKQRLSALR